MKKGREPRATTEAELKVTPADISAARKRFQESTPVDTRDLLDATPEEK